MADYGLKYLCEYRSKMRGRLLYRIEIEERGAVALTDETALRMRPYSDVFTLKWGNADDPEYTAVKGSSLTLKILCVDDMEYLALFSVDPLKFRVTIYEYRTDTSGVEQRLMLWRGFLSASSYKETFAAPPYVVTLSASDGFALLDSMPFRDALGVKFSGRASLSSLLTSCMEALGIDLPVSEWVSIDGAGGAERTLKSIYVDRTRIYEIDGEISWKSVLELAVKPFLGQIFQAGGVIHVRRIGSLAGTFRPGSFLSNERLIGLERPRILPMWEERCDLRASSELELCAPYRNAIVAVDNSRETDANRKYYDSAMWIKTVDDPTAYFFEDRIVFGIDSAFFFQSMTLPVFYPASKADVTISISLYNLLTEYKIKAYVEVHALIDGKENRWDNTRQIWHLETGGYPFEEIDAAQGPALLEYYDEKYVSPYTPSSQLPGHDFKITVTNIPANSDGSPCEFSLFIGAQGASDFGGGPNSHWIMVSNIEVKTSEGDEREDLFSKSIAVTGSNVNDCSIDIPIRDGGYRSNMGNILVCPILGDDGLPIVSWLAPTERGDLLHMAGEEILQLRSTVSRQISGELRCRRTVDLNSLFEDGKFTRAVYYLNSLELLAARQVYKVQLRELQSLSRMLPAGVLTPVRTFDEPMELVCSLYGSLFFRTGAGPYGVAIYNTENGELLRLAYASDSLAIRKGLSAVVIQVGTTDLYAVDNLGSVLSHLDAGPSSVLNFATALYDGDRRSWVSYTADAATSKTDVTIFTRNLELESKNDMAVVATGLMLISNGYVLQVADGPAWWHNYELHPSEKIETASCEVLAVSDSLLVVTGEDTILTRLEIEIRRRTDQLLGASKLLGKVSIPRVFSSFGRRMFCNCAIAALVYMDAASKRIVECYDLRTERVESLSFDENVDAAICGDRIYILRGGELLGLRMDDVRTVAYTLTLDYESGDLTYTVEAAGYDKGFSVDVVTNGTPYVVASDERLGVTLVMSEAGSHLDLVIPPNATSLAIDYDPVVVGIYEDPTLTRRLFISQKGGERKVFFDCSQSPYQDEYDQDVNLIVKRGEENLVNKTVSRIDFDNDVATFTFTQIEEILGVSLADHVGDTLMYYSQTYWAGAGAEIPAEGDIRILL